jgi:hypothetical protein
VSQCDILMYSMQKIGVRDKLYSYQQFKRTTDLNCVASVQKQNASRRDHDASTAARYATQTGGGHAMTPEPVLVAPRDALHRAAHMDIRSETGMEF